MNTNREKWEKMAKDLLVQNKGGWTWSQHGNFIVAVADAIEKAVAPYKELAEQLKQGIQQVVPLGAVDQIVRQQEEIDRLRAELEAERREVQTQKEINETGRAAHNSDRVRLDEIGRYLAEVRAEYSQLKSELERAKITLEKINTIRNSIVGFQSINWSEHIYPLVAALDEAGIEGMDYPEAKQNFGTMLERTNKAEAEFVRLKSELKLLRTTQARMEQAHRQRERNLMAELERATKERSEWWQAARETNNKAIAERDAVHQQLQEACELLKHLHKEVLATDYNEHWESFIKLETFLAMQGRKDKWVNYSMNYHYINLHLSYY